MRRRKRPPPFALPNDNNPPGRFTSWEQYHAFVRAEYQAYDSLSPAFRKLLRQTNNQFEATTVKQNLMLRDYYDVAKQLIECDKQVSRHNQLQWSNFLCKKL